MAKKELSYDMAQIELKQILEELQSESVGIDKLADQIIRAKHLIEVCRTKLREVEAGIESIKQDS